jgi:phosphoribosylaminoimidazolecarboxamide formyltransferase / IMP cyclohydrolase
MMSKKIYRKSEAPVLSEIKVKEATMTLNIVERIDDQVRVRHVLISVSDKRGLDRLCPGLVRLCPGVRILSTGGTFKAIADILGGDASRHLVQVSDYTGQPETQGGLVKTLDFKIYLGLLTETYNASHRADLERTGAVPIDMAVVNLYPFRETIARQGVTPEEARGNIDIGGPCMIRAAAKNYIRVASVVDPGDYEMIIQTLEGTGGRTSLDLRLKLARKAFAHTAEYDQAIADYLKDAGWDAVSSCYNF